MKTISTLTAPTVVDDGKPSPIKPQAAFVRAGKTIQPKFWRRARITAKGVILESSAGGQVLVTHDALWAEAEKHEPLLSIPKST